VDSGKRMAVLVSGDSQEKLLVQKTCDCFEIPLVVFTDFGSLAEWEGKADLIVLSATGAAEDASQNGAACLSELVQGTKQLQPAAFVLVIAGDALSKDDGTFLRKSGAGLVVLKTELTTTGKLAFALSQILRSAYIPVKVSELVVGVETPFALYHLLPQRGKFLLLHPSETELSAEKYEKMKSVAEYYIRRSDCTNFNRYVKETAQDSEGGLALRCRANFLALQQEFTTLVMSITDRSEVVSFGEGQDLLGRCRRLCEELLANLSAYPKAWEVINLSSIGEFGSVERAPAVTAYCALFGIHLDIQGLPELMLVALLGETGLLHLPESLLDKLRTGVACSDPEKELLSQVPTLSLKVILDKKISLEDKWRKVLVRTRARADGDARVTKESQLLHLARLFDQKSLLRVGGARGDPHQLLNDLIQAD
jgi:hypothetical protein